MKVWLQVTAGQGPLECAWVVSHLIPLIMREAKALQIKGCIEDQVMGEVKEALYSVLLSFEGEDLNSFVQSWQGTIQWIGQSPFRVHHKRKNWFVGVNRIAMIGESYQLNDQTCEIKTMKASGPGGQHVNKTESAVHIKHIPTGLIVRVQEARSQHANKSLALARLAVLLQEREQQLKEKRDHSSWRNHEALERGNPTRIYVGFPLILKK